MNKKLLLPEVQKFIKDHQYDDPFLLSLKTKKSAQVLTGKGDFPLAEAISQIQSRQKAKGKLPNWYSRDGIIWPPAISIEQSSSEKTARYKSSLINGESIADLTGGMGVDTCFFADQFERVIYIESNEKLSRIASHNFEVFGKTQIVVETASAEEFLNENTGKIDAIYIDPSRRFEDKKVFKIEDCSPNLYKIVPRCKSITGQILVKLSPLVDLSLLIKDFLPSGIWIVAVKGEVKEVLCLIKNEKKQAKIHAIDLLSNGEKAVFEFDADDEANTQSEFSLPMQYMYEPNAAILKSGAFKLIGQKFGLKKLHQHTHLYTSDEYVKDFPGKILRIYKSLNQNKKEIQKAIPGKKINVITRNHPLSTEQLKRKYGLKDGGDQFFIGTTLMDGKKVLLFCEKLN